jgi:flagellar basal-body rod modification protein FlgD
MARFSWDGRDASGERVASGQYQLSARAVRGTEIESVPTLIESSVESVTLGRSGEGLTLNLVGGDRLSLAQVRQIN